MIPLSVPYLNGNEWKYIKECLDTNWVSSAGKYVDLFEHKIAEYTGTNYAIACVNGTAALQVSLRLAGVQPGDEVIAPTLTFIAPINAIAYNGASPVFMDADDYYNIDSVKTIRFIQEETEFKEGYSYNRNTGKRVSAIVPVHVWGNACWFDDLVDVCRERNIAIVEDASESLGTRYTQGKFAGKHTGTIGKLGCISFNGNKIITTGGGGMILTNDEEIAAKARYLTTQAKDDEIKYIHNEVGYNYRLTNIQAALGVAQLEQLPDILMCKAKIHSYYQMGLISISGLKLVFGPSYASNNYWLNSVFIEPRLYGKDINQVIIGLLKDKVESRPVWVLNHTQQPYSNHQAYLIEKALILKTTISLPSSATLTKEQVKQIVGILSK